MFEEDAVAVTCWDLAGHEVLHLRVRGSDLASDVHLRVVSNFKVIPQSLRVVLPDGQLLASTCRANPLATIADVGGSNTVSMADLSQIQTKSAQ